MKVLLLLLLLLMMMMMMTMMTMVMVGKAKMDGCDVEKVNLEELLIGTLALQSIVVLIVGLILFFAVLFLYNRAGGGE